MARVEIPVVVTDPVTGHAIQGASVQVNKRSDGTPASLFADETSGTTTANPLTSDSKGDVVGWVARGAYNLVITAAGYATKTVAWDAVPGSDAGIDAAALSGGTVPSGVVMDWPYSEATIPAGWLACFGQALLRSTYAALHTLAAASSYPHGSGDGTTTFNAPDYRGRDGVGKDDMGGVAANRVTNAGSGITGTTLGATGGVEIVSLTTTQIPAHGHSLTGSPTLSGTPSISDPTHRHIVYHSTLNNGGSNYPAGNGSSDGVGTGSNDFNSDAITLASTGITAGLGTLAVAAGSLAVSNAGGGGAHTNMQPALIVNKIIKT